MVNNIWNNKLAGLPGATWSVFSIMWARFADWLTTRVVLGNLKYHGKKIRLMRGCVFRYPQWVVIADNVIVGKDTVFTAEICKEYDNFEGKGFLSIEKGVSIGNNCEIDFSGGITINKEAHLAHHVHIITHNHGYNYKNQPTGTQLEIGEMAFIGSGSIILDKCCRIGKSSVVGAGSVVTKDIPDYAVVAGNPARVIRFIQFE